METDENCIQGLKQGLARPWPWAVGESDITDREAEEERSTLLGPPWGEPLGHAEGRTAEQRCPNCWETLTGLAEAKVTRVYTLLLLNHFNLGSVISVIFRRKSTFLSFFPPPFISLVPHSFIRQPCCRPWSPMRVPDKQPLGCGPGNAVCKHLSFDGDFFN